MKAKKGDAGYIRTQKRRRTFYTTFLFAVSIAVFLTGYFTTHTRNNVLTIVAVLGCLPAAKAAVGLIILLPYHTIDEKKQILLREKAPLITVAYDLVITSREKIMPIDVIAISGHLVCGYVSRTKVDLAYTEKYIKTTLKENHYDKMTVKLFTDYNAFLGRAEGMNNIEAVEKPENHRIEKSIKDILLNIAI
ncbi:hypothetical protein [Sellimonas sp.]|uniref:hypothetical protein n=1 Tax=Sellimonas sp. TaxID=2021466 RepID=UPI00257A3B4F|nr:hypothetical protein [Sellimonas sp.]